MKISVATIFTAALLVGSAAAEYYYPASYAAVDYEFDSYEPALYRRDKNKSGTAAPAAAHCVHRRDYDGQVYRRCFPFSRSRGNSHGESHEMHSHPRPASNPPPYSPGGVAHVPQGVAAHGRPPSYGSGGSNAPSLQGAAAPGYGQHVMDRRIPGPPRRDSTDYHDTIREMHGGH